MPRSGPIFFITTPSRIRRLPLHSEVFSLLLILRSETAYGFSMSEAVRLRHRWPLSTCSRKCLTIWHISSLPASIPVPRPSHWQKSSLPPIIRMFACTQSVFPLKEQQCVNKLATTLLSRVTLSTNFGKKNPIGRKDD